MNISSKYRLSASLITNNRYRPWKKHIGLSLKQSNRLHMQAALWWSWTYQCDMGHAGTCCSCTIPHIAQHQPTVEGVWDLFYYHRSFKSSRQSIFKFKLQSSTMTKKKNYFNTSHGLYQQMHFVYLACRWFILSSSYLRVKLSWRQLRNLVSSWDGMWYVTKGYRQS